MIRFSLFFGVFLLANTSSDAAVILTFSEYVGGVRAAYAGQMDTTSLNFGGGLTFDDRFFDVDGDRTIEFQNAQPSPQGQHPAYLGTSFRYSAENFTFDLQLDLAEPPYFATSAFGDTFGFLIFERLGEFNTRINLPHDYVSNSSIQGELRFDGESFVSMGLEPGERFQMSLPGGESIAIQVAIPEPESGALIALSLLLGAFRRRRRRSN